MVAMVVVVVLLVVAVVKRKSESRYLVLGSSSRCGDGELGAVEPPTMAVETEVEAVGLSEVVSFPRDPFLEVLVILVLGPLGEPPSC